MLKTSQYGGKKGASEESHVKEWALQNLRSLQIRSLYLKNREKHCRCLRMLLRVWESPDQTALLGLCLREKGKAGRGPEQDWKPCRRLPHWLKKYMVGSGLALDRAAMRLVGEKRSQL